jgi:hypothetical protein
VSVSGRRRFFGLEENVAYQLMRAGGGGPHEPWCTSCKSPITAEQQSVRIDFANDPHGHEGLSGLYHAECGKVFQSLARAINMLSFRPF